MFSWLAGQDGTGGSPTENRSAKAVIEKKHLLSNKMQSFAKIGMMKRLELGCCQSYFFVFVVELYAGKMCCMY